MLPIDAIVNRMANGGRMPRLREIWLEHQTARVFGDRIAAHIAGLRCEGKRVLILVDDPLWVTELTRNRQILLEKVRAIVPGVREVEILCRR